MVLEYTPPGWLRHDQLHQRSSHADQERRRLGGEGDQGVSIAGIPATAKWDLTVKEPGLTYALDFTIESEADVIGPCKWEGHPKGVLTKVG